MSFLSREAARNHAQFQSERYGRTRPGRRDARDLAVRADAVVGALSAVGLLDPGEAESWRSHLSERRAAPPPLAQDTSALAADVLEELLAVVPVVDEWGSLPLSRFQGALDALVRVGAADRDVWDGRLAARMGWLIEDEQAAAARARELNAGGTEQDLIAVLAGPSEPMMGLRVLFALRFTDGISFWIGHQHQSDRRAGEDGPGGLDWAWPRLELRDDVGTEYRGAGSASAGEESQLTFRTAPPDNASWVELIVDGGDAIRVIL
jgi:hypothetical protein